MPVIREGGEAHPEWCELYDYSIVNVEGAYTWETAHPSRRLVVVDGEHTVVAKSATRGTSIEIETEGPVLIEGDGRVVLLEGAWGADCGGSGLFGVGPSTEPDRKGDTWDYRKNTDFDRHYHDCDEYWIVVDGAATVVTEGVHFDVAVGDCVATRMGDHHDVALVESRMGGVFFETTMRGRRRRGHLWNHTHGEPQVRR